MRLLVTDDYDALSELAASLVLARWAAAESFVLGLAAGRTPAGLYARLAAGARRAGLDPGLARFLDLDEYLGVPATDPGSLAGALRREFLGPLGADPTRIHLFDGRAKNPELECKKREELLASIGGVNLQLLGLGENGHLAFNEPGSSFGSRTRVVELAPETRSAFKGRSAAPARAITEGLATILSARRILLVASGEKKAEPLARAIEGPVDEAVPGSALQLHPDVIVVADRAAASRLAGRPRLVEEVPDLAVRQADDLPGDLRVAVVSPHPDDASIGCGGLLSLLAQRQVTVLSFASGHRADIPGKTRSGRIRLRRRELEEECRILGAELRLLDLAFYDDDYAFRSDDVRRVADVLAELEAGWILSPTPKDRHPAHRTSALLTLEAVRRLFEDGRRSDPIEFWEYEGPWHLFDTAQINAVVPLPARALATKRAGIAQHVSQMERGRYDEASLALARYRAITLPELALADFGKTAADLGDGVEAFRRVILSRSGAGASERDAGQEGVRP
ncbi:MAG: 6-phosphogluconolactonase [Planctomycetes bacterium]|nr:6-phosphogluconolactonase [Planctomycetota bacterium]